VFNKGPPNVPLVLGGINQNRCVAIPLLEIHDGLSLSCKKSPAVDIGRVFFQGPAKIIQELALSRPADHQAHDKNREAYFPISASHPISSLSIICPYFEDIDHN
jgi:hypothetical protein